MIRKLLTLCLLSPMLLAPAFGEDRATVVMYPNGVNYVVAIVNGTPFFITNVTVHKLDEVKPPNPQTGLAEQLLVIRDQRQPKHVPVLLDLQFKYQRGTKPELYLLDNIDTSNPVVQACLKIKQDKAPNAAFPYYFLVDAKGKVLDHGEVKATTEANVEQIKKFQEK